MSKLYYLIFIRGENAVVKQHLDELLQIELALSVIYNEKYE